MFTLKNFIYLFVNTEIQAASGTCPITSNGRHMKLYAQSCSLLYSSRCYIPSTWFDKRSRDCPTPLSLALGAYDFGEIYEYICKIGKTEK